MSQFQGIAAKDRVRPVLLVLPLIAFIVVTFLLPLGTMFKESLYDGEVAKQIPETMKLLQNWNAEKLPDPEVYETLAREIVVMQENRTIGKVVIRINRIAPGTRSVWGKTGRQLRNAEVTDYKAKMIEIDDRWSELTLWRGIKEAGTPFSARNYLRAVDLEKSEEGSITLVKEEQRVYGSLYMRTLYVAFMVTLLTLIIGYPIAYGIANVPPTLSKIMLLCVLVPFWTSLLARATSWIVLLQEQGVINDVLVWMGVTDDNNRISMMYNMTGTLVAMTHNLLPFMILPTYAVLSSIPPTYMRAASSLGANPLQSFVRVYLPQSLPGIAAGSLLVFILSIGYFITPAIVGGTKGQLISNLIEYHISNNNWGLGAAISVIVLLSVIILYVLFDRWVGVDKLKLS